MDITKLIDGIFSWRTPVVTPLLDNTEYRIATNTHEYHGRIIYQDDFSIKFQSQKNKTVRILKSNINQMSVIPSNKNNALPIRKIN